MMRLCLVVESGTRLLRVGSSITNDHEKKVSYAGAWSRRSCSGNLGEGSGIKRKKAKYRILCFSPRSLLSLFI